MKYISKLIKQFNSYFITFTDRFSHNILRFNIGFIYFLFGALKFFPNSSPAEQLAINTVTEISYGYISGNSALYLLAVIETVLGLCILFNYQIKCAIYVALGHMIGTFLPIYLYPEQAFTDFPVGISLMGQYIIKNLVVVSALLVLHARISDKQSKVIIMRIKEDIPNDIEYRNYQINHSSETVQHTLTALRK